MARDWKGWNTYGSTAIVESEKIDDQKRLGGLWDGETKHQAGSVWDSNGMSPTLDTAQGGGRQPHIVEEIAEPKERFFKQALETFNNNECSEGDTIDAFNKRVNKSGYCPTLTTRPEGFKTAILPVVKEETQKSIWKDINSNYKISSKGIVVDVVNKCQVEEVDGKVILEVNGKKGSVPVKKLMEKYFKDEPSFVIGSTQKNAFVGNGEISSALTSAMGMGGGHVPMVGFENNSKPICVGNTTPSGKSQCNAVYSTEGVSQTLCAGTHGYATGSILEEKKLDKINNQEAKEIIGIKQATKKGYIECELPGCADLSYPSSTTRRGRVQDNGQTSPTITATETGVHYIESIYRIRKLTVRECFKLMSFEFEDWDKCAAIGISNSAGYKAAGNSICCCCISLLFEHLYQAQYDESYICTDEKMQNFQKPEVE